MERMKNQMKRAVERELAITSLREKSALMWLVATPMMSTNPMMKNPNITGRRALRLLLLIVYQIYGLLSLIFQI